MYLMQIVRPMLLVAIAMATPAQADQLRPLVRPENLVPAGFIAPSAVTPAPEEVAEATPAPARQIAPIENAPILGPETNLPLPRFVSLKRDEVNVRRGPSQSHRIDWIFLRRGMPVQVTAEYENWRRVVDHEGLGGWVHHSLLTGTRTVLVEEDQISIYARPDPSSQQQAILQIGVIARLGECIPDWCEITADDYTGWAENMALWGVFPDVSNY